MPANGKAKRVTLTIQCLVRSPGIVSMKRISTLISDSAISSGLIFYSGSLKDIKIDSKHKSEVTVGTYLQEVWGKLR
jgi:hypothetical protein